VIDLEFEAFPDTLETFQLSQPFRSLLFQISGGAATKHSRDEI
jgi:hypothetical protein